MCEICWGQTPKSGVTKLIVGLYMSSLVGHYGPQFWSSIALGNLILHQDPWRLFAHFSPAAVEISWSLSKQLCWRGHAGRPAELLKAKQWLCRSHCPPDQQTVCFWSDIINVYKCITKSCHPSPLRRVQDLILSWRLSFTNKNTTRALW